MSESMLWSRMKVSKKKWAWAVWNTLDDIIEGKPPVDAGYSEIEPCLAGKYLHTWPARSWHEKQVAQRKAQRVARGSDTRPVEYLYIYDGDGEDYDMYRREWRQVPITRKTKTRVFVCFASRTYSLPRESLEREGKVYSHPARTIFYLQPPTCRCLPRCCDVLGLQPPVTVDKVKKAFRTLVRKVHPDAGGSSAEFQLVYQAYEEALKLCHAS